MGIGSISLPQLLIVLLLVVLLFGSKRLGSLGSDLGSAIKGFKKAISDDNKDQDTETPVVKQEQKQAHNQDDETKS